MSEYEAHNTKKEHAWSHIIIVKIIKLCGNLQNFTAKNRSTGTLSRTYNI